MLFSFLLIIYCESFPQIDPPLGISTPHCSAVQVGTCLETAIIPGFLRKSTVVATMLIKFLGRVLPLEHQVHRHPGPCWSFGYPHTQNFFFRPVTFPACGSAQNVPHALQFIRSVHISAPVISFILIGPSFLSSDALSLLLTLLPISFYINGKKGIYNATKVLTPTE